jgi:hypothetical protein
MIIRKTGAAVRPQSSQPPSGSNDFRNLDARLDEALEETFPASDPVAVTRPRPKVIRETAK